MDNRSRDRSSRWSITHRGNRSSGSSTMLPSQASRHRLGGHSRTSLAQIVGGSTRINTGVTRPRRACSFNIHYDENSGDESEHSQGQDADNEVQENDRSDEIMEVDDTIYDTIHVQMPTHQVAPNLDHRAVLEVPQQPASPRSSRDGEYVLDEDYIPGVGFVPYIPPTLNSTAPVQSPFTGNNDRLAAYFTSLQSAAQAPLPWEQRLLNTELQGWHPMNTEGMNNAWNRDAEVWPFTSTSSIVSSLSSLGRTPTPPPGYVVSSTPNMDNDPLSQSDFLSGHVLTTVPASATATAANGMSMSPSQILYKDYRFTCHICEAVSSIHPGRRYALEFPELFTATEHNWEQRAHVMNAASSAGMGKQGEGLADRIPKPVPFLTAWTCECGHVRCLECRLQTRVTVVNETADSELGGQERRAVKDRVAGGWMDEAVMTKGGDIEERIVVRQQR